MITDDLANKMINVYQSSNNSDFSKTEFPELANVRNIRRIFENEEMRIAASKIKQGGR